MKVWAAVIAIVVGCGGDDDCCTVDAAVQSTCKMLETSVVDLRDDLCTLPSTPVFGGRCPTVWPVRCGADGDAASCPPGWAAQCDASMANCTYNIVNSGTDQCQTLTAGTVLYGARATLNGADGLSILIDPATNSCEFRACQ